MALLEQDSRALGYLGDLKNFLGLKMFLSLLKQLEIAYIRINGAGLRYGIFHQQLLLHYPGFELESSRYTHLWKEKVICKGAVLEGMISKINRQGIFVRVGDSEGLIHLRTLQKKGIDRPKGVFEHRDFLRVRVTSILEERGKTLINLSIWDVHGQRL